MTRPAMFTGLMNYNNFNGEATGQSGEQVGQIRVEGASLPNSTQVHKGHTQRANPGDRRCAYARRGARTTNTPRQDWSALASVVKW
jgi:hypothetical protein